MNLCSGCGVDFASVDAFDKHRTGSYTPNKRRCRDDAEMKRVGLKPDKRGRMSLRA